MIDRNEISEKEYPDLYDYVTRIGVVSYGLQTTAIRKMTLPHFSRVVLEMREAVIKKVKKAIPENCTLPILFLLGSSGSGKSTTLCFLRGDKMKNTIIHGYTSENDTNQYIEHSATSSGAVLPNIEVTKDFVLVDYTGFSHTSGIAVNLGMELALKALLAEFPSRVLVHQYFSDSDTAIKDSAELGGRLSRLFANKEDCLLGLTKYSKNVTYLRIKSQARLLNDNSIPVLKTCTIINESIESLNQAEGKVLKRVGVKKFIKLLDLNDPDILNAALQALSENKKVIKVNPKLALDYSDKNTLISKFDDYLINELPNSTSDSNEKANCLQNFELFKKVVKEHSLIYAIDNSEVRQIFDLPEMDPVVIKEVDKRLLNECMEKYKEAIIRLDIPALKEHLMKVRQTTKVQELTFKLSILENCIKDLLNITDEKEWIRKVKISTSSKDTAEKLFQLPNWINKVSCIPADIPTNLYSLIKRYTMDNAISDLGEIRNFVTKNKTAIVRAYMKSAMEETQAMINSAMVNFAKDQLPEEYIERPNNKSTKLIESKESHSPKEKTQSIPDGVLKKCIDEINKVQTVLSQLMDIQSIILQENKIKVQPISYNTSSSQFQLFANKSDKSKAEKQISVNDENLISKKSYSL